MVYSLKRYLAKNYVNARGWRTKRKFLLIESDDWGAIRMPSRQVYERLVAKNIAVDKLHIDKYDSLESIEDLDALFNVLAEFKDINNHNAVITAFCVVANPDFEKVENSNRMQYFYELVSETYKRSSHTENSLEKIHAGIKAGLFFPQFHGREHIHTQRWLKAINSTSQKEQIAFKERAVISSKMINDDCDYACNYFAAYFYSSPKELDYLKGIILDGLCHFERLFGYKSKTFYSQGSIWGNGILETLANYDVKLIGGQQWHPDGHGNLKLINKFWGTKNNYNQLHWRRNCLFEPARNQNYDWLNHCLKEIEIAFRWGKPAVVSSHRENYIGSIFPENRAESLKKLRQLLKKIQEKWPEVEFIDTRRLGTIMMKELL